MAWNPENLQRYEDEMRQKRIEQQACSDRESLEWENEKLRRENAKMYVGVEGPQDLIDAANHLALSDKGRNAMRHVLVWLDEDGLSLDFTNKEAVLTLLNGAWGKYAGTARDAMRDALED